MKRFVSLVPIALLVVVSGTACSLISSRHHSAMMADSKTGAASQAAILPPPTSGSDDQKKKTVDLESVYVKGAKLSYAGYDVERALNTKTDISTATITRNGRVLAVLEHGGFGEDSTQMGLFSFLGRETKQLVIMQYTGGAHCCWIYRIYDLEPTFRVLFDGNRYGIDSIGYELLPQDIDGDGKYEFVQAAMPFDYFHMSHASSVFPSALFAYDEKQKSYRPANREFSAYLLEDIQKYLDAIPKVRPSGLEADKIDGRETYLAAVLRVMLTYIYAGEEQQGWEFYDKEYKLTDRDEIKRDIRKTLAADRFYRELYRQKVGGTRKP